MQDTSSGLVTPDQVVVETPPLELPIQDDVVLAALEFAETRGKTVREKYNIDARTKENIDFYKGNQIDPSQLDTGFQMAHVDNVVRQDLENKIKLATGHMPDIFVSPPDNQDFNVEWARDIQNFIRDRLDSGTNKRLLKNGLRKLDLELIAILKVRWKYLEKDFCFELIDSRDVLFGEGARIYDDGYTIDGTDVVFHYVEEPTQQVMNTFKPKAGELRELLQAKGDIPSRIRYTEAHFRWVDRNGKSSEGVVWRYDRLILGKMRTPYYDYDNPQINYFDRPRKPFIILSYTNLGDTVYETTTDFEQGKPINRIINKRRRQITEIADRSVPKMVFTANAMTKEQARNINPSPNEAIILNGDEADVNKAFASIPVTPPSPFLYNDLLDLRGRIDSIFSTHGQTRGEIVGSANQSGLSKQISREGDLITSDDLGQVVLERCVGEMAGWVMQLMRQFFDDDRPPARVTNSDGETDFVELTRQKIETDIQVVVKASSNDKQIRRADALQLLEAKAIDPYSLLEDLDVPAPRERFRRLMAFIQAQQSGDFTQYADVVGVDLDSAMATAEDAQRDIDILLTGQNVRIRMPSEAYVSTLSAFTHSPEFNSSDVSEEARQAVRGHIQRLREYVAKKADEQQQTAGTDSQQMVAGQPRPPQADTGAAFAAPQQGSPLIQALQNRNVNAITSQMG